MNTDAQNSQSAASASSSNAASSNAASSNAASSKTIVVEDFANPTNTWKTLNDPVMGGKSYSSVTIEDGVAKFKGECAIVPSLQAPGFITMETGSQFLDKPSIFPDVSSCTAISLELRTNTDYNGYRVSFGKAHPKGGRFAFGYKAPLKLSDLPPVGEFGEVVIPFDQFSDKWNDATGDIEVECKDDPQYCPSQQWLKKMETMSFWGEGVEGMVDLEVKSIAAIGCDASALGTAEAAPMLRSKIHTIGSNPVYTGMAVVLAVLATLVGLCLFCCCCSRRRTRSNFRKAPIVAAATVTTETSFKDDAWEATEAFSDEMEMTETDPEDDTSVQIS